jgi:hypothetical protein
MSTKSLFVLGVILLGACSEPTSPVVGEGHQRQGPGQVTCRTSPPDVPGSGQQVTALEKRCVPVE